MIKMDELETRLNEETSKTSSWDKVKGYLEGCINPDNAKLYGNFQERAALNITQFPKIQGSLLIRMGIVYPLMSYITEQIGVPKDCSTDIFGMTINYHTWIAGYLAYLTEIQLGLSKYPIEYATKYVKMMRGYFDKKHTAAQ